MRLMKYVLKYFRNLKVDYITLGTHSENKMAQGLYKKLSPTKVQFDTEYNALMHEQDYGTRPEIIRITLRDQRTMHLNNLEQKMDALHSPLTSIASRSQVNKKFSMSLT